MLFWGAQWVLSEPGESQAVSAGPDVFEYLSVVLFCGQLQALFVLACFWSLSTLEEATSHNCFKTESGIVSAGTAVVVAISKIQTESVKGTNGILKGEWEKEEIISATQPKTYILSREFD